MSTRAPWWRPLSVRRLYVLVFALAVLVVPVLPTSAAPPAPLSGAAGHGVMTVCVCEDRTAAPLAPRGR